MKKLATLLFSVLLMASASVCARSAEPVVDWVDQSVTTASGKALTTEELQKVLVRAAEAKKWLVTPQPDGKALASLSWNGGKHTIVVELTSTTERYSLRYKDSINMKYGMRDEKPVIHPHYNRFVGELRDAIRVELLKL